MKKAIQGYENYLITDSGQVYNQNTKKYLKGSIGANGYIYFRLSKNNQKKMFYAHRLVAEAFLLKEDFEKRIVNHINGDKTDNRKENLEWVTYSENISHWHKTIKRKNQNNNNFIKQNIVYQDEVWKDYKNYLVSNYGRIQNKKSLRFLQPSITCGYYKVVLSQNGKKESWQVHRLVYSLFVGSLKENEIIDHIDGNKLNNYFGNLRQISPKENCLNAYYVQKLNSCIKPVNQYDLNGNFIQSFQSISKASQILNIDSSSISKACRGKLKTTGGFIFKYKEPSTTILKQSPWE